MRLFGRRRRDGEGDRGNGGSAGGRPVLIVGLGNPERRYAHTRHNLGFEVAAELAHRWELPRAKERFRGRISEGRAGPGGPQVAVLLPQTFMNESGASAGPARGALKVPLEMVVVLHDEIDLPFGEVRSKLGGGVAGHNGLKSLAQGLGGPDSTDPEIVSAHVLSRFAEPEAEVLELIGRAADETERVVRELARASDEVAVDADVPAAPPEPEPGDSKRRLDAGGAQESPE